MPEKRLMYMNVSQDIDTGEWTKSYCVEGSSKGQAKKSYPISPADGQIGSMRAYSFCETTYNVDTGKMDGPRKASHGIMVGIFANQFGERHVSPGLCIVCFKPNGNDGVKFICNKKKCKDFLKEIMA